MMNTNTLPMPFVRNGESPEAELRNCMRYYEKSYDPTTNPGTSTTNGIFMFPGDNVNANHIASAMFKTHKRAVPSISTWDAVGNAGEISYWNSSFAQTNAGANGAPVAFTGISSVALRESNIGSGAVAFGLHWVANAQI